MGFRVKYWSNTQIGNWVRGIKKPKSETMEGWDEWNITARNLHPIRYAIVEEIFPKLQNAVNWPTDKLHDVKSYILNRWFTETHALVAHPRDIKRGRWEDTGSRFLPCLFNSLVDFVEVELAWNMIMWNFNRKELRKKYKMKMFPHLRGWRSAEAGIDSLKEQCVLIMDESWGHTKDDPNYGKLTSQAEASTEILALYTWWTTVYPKRLDPYIVSGWREFHSDRRIGRIGPFAKLTTEDREEEHRLMKIIEDMESSYQKEDEEMMIRLIKIRERLWT
jgi:hypothetical protein